MPSPPSFFNDEAFQDYLVGLLVRDAKCLKELAHLLNPNDFKPQRGSRSTDARSRWLIAERALEFYSKHRTPVRRLITADVLEYAESIQMGERKVRETEEYIARLFKKKLVAPDSIVEKVQRYKHEKMRSAAIEELVELQGSGQLTDEKWAEVTQRVGSASRRLHLSDYYGEYEERLRRRGLEIHSRIGSAPAFLIDPLDSIVRGCGFGQLGLCMAPTKRGKSLFLLWLAIAFTLQKLNTVFVTLEDPKDEVENRLDSAVSGVPYHRLAERPVSFRKRFQRFLRFVRGRLRILDGTDESLTVTQIDQLVDRERDKGFQIDAVLVDYDDEVKPTIKRKERRFEFADIYRDMRKAAARSKTIWWTAAQTQRGTEKLKILSGERLAEDFSKARKAAMTVGLGQGDWSDDSIYAWVAYHKFDKMHVGCHIVPDKERMLIYDRYLTSKLSRENEEKDEEGDEV